MDCKGEGLRELREASELALNGTAGARGPGACIGCKVKKAGRDGLCGGCRLVRLKRQKYPPIPQEIVNELRLAYVGNVREVSANLKRIAARTGISTHRLKDEGRRKGWRTTRDRRPWTPFELTHLQELLGSFSVSQIARKLRRSITSCNVRISRLKLSRRLSEGYNVSDLCEVFGLAHTRIERWISRGLLGEPEGRGGHGGNIRFSTEAVALFVRRYPDLYDLGRVDQNQFKQIVFGHFADEEETCP